MTNKLSPELTLINNDPEHPVYEIIPKQPTALADKKLGDAANRRCFDPRTFSAISLELPANTPVNEVEAQAQLYGKFGVSAATMASSPVKNEIYDLSAYGNLSND